ncbi:MAG: helix-turn-helix domain-containing protein [Polyangiaceae bacterium]|nr:helix-turn-helix domain-containing protein [Myxococcales bacterium]MCB9586200.1 helix-turn-helix domain-containing protein [Polyangiaceae bacterium]MCB9606877.1 helix-turn-helix domain-containing protein [Polyangiaceae bacterium]
MSRFAFGDPPLWPPLLAIVGGGASTRRHAHHALHLVLALEGELSLGVGVQRHRGAGVLTAPNVEHEIDAGGVQRLLVFLDPESDAGRELLATVEGSHRMISPRQRDALIRGVDPVALMSGGGVAWAARAAEILGAAPASPLKLHRGVRKVLKHLKDQGTAADTSLESLAAVAGISSGRFMHVFTESVGIPLRPYLAWLKLQRAVSAIVGGRTLSQAALAAGFSDSAHMSRAFSRMLGIRPRELLRSVQFNAAS